MSFTTQPASQHDKFCIFLSPYFFLQFNQHMLVICYLMASMALTENHIFYRDHIQSVEVHLISAATYIESFFLFVLFYLLFPVFIYFCSVCFILSQLIKSFYDSVLFRKCLNNNNKLPQVNKISALFPPETGLKGTSKLIISH